MTLFYNESLKIGILLIFAIFLSFLLIFISHAFSIFNPDSEKVSAYECGFDPFNNKDLKTNITIRFYLIGILFLIFDIELVFLYPWAISLTKISYFGYWTMCIFLIILTIGFAYEWKKGALDWE